MNKNIDKIMQQAARVAPVMAQQSPAEIARLLDTIAGQIEAIGDTLIETAGRESNLPEGRLRGERGRTCNQLRLFAEHVREGSWLDAVIDTALPDRQPFPRADIRRVARPLGPVVVFGASNFPLAFSTAGGDTASALAAGCPVVIKGHPAHPDTSQLVFEAMQRALSDCNLPSEVIQHVSGVDYAIGQLLVQHPATRAVGFTGSLSGGQALVEYAQERARPIPVFAEMGSVNPVIFLPQILAENAETLATQYANSITMGVGQFCTKPGLLLAIEGEDLKIFTEALRQTLAEKASERMLHEGIGRSYRDRLQTILRDQAAEIIQSPARTTEMLQATPALATAAADRFLRSAELKEEVFGPFALIVRCQSIEQMGEVLRSVKGQLTTTIMGTSEELEQYAALIPIAEQIAGRVLFNGVPTGVEVGHAMVHGGPWPATTDSRFTSVGTNAIQRWLRPVCYQNCPDHLLPPALQNANPLGISRRVNGEWTQEPVSGK